MAGIKRERDKVINLLADPLPATSAELRAREFAAAELRAREFAAAELRAAASEEAMISEVE